MNDPAAGLSILHVIVRAGATNSQYNEHCLPVVGERKITVCSLFPADVTPPPSGLTLFEGDGTTRGCWRALRRALAFGEYDVVHVHAPASGVLTLAAYFWTRRSRQDLVFTVHNSWASFRRRNRLFLRIILALFPLIVVCGRAAHDSMPRRLRQRRSHKLTVVPNGVDVDRIDTVLADHDRPRGEHCAGESVITVSRLIPIKDPLTLVSAFADASQEDDRLVVVGEGPLRRDVQVAARDRGLSGRVRLTGLMPRNDVYRLLDESDVFVTTSRGEGLPVAMLEAMACGVPVVASDIAPHREIAVLARQVPLVPVGDRSGFARATARMLALTPTEREKLGRDLRACVVDNFSVRAMNRGYGELYSRIAATTGGRYRGNLRPAEQVAQGEETLPEKMRRRAAWLALFTILGGIGGYAYTQVQGPVYKAETTLMVGSASGAAAGEDELKLSAALALTYTDLARREPVLGPVAKQGFADSWRELHRNVHVQTGTQNPQLIQISAYGSDAAEASSLATAVAERLERVADARTSSPQLEFLADQVRSLEKAITITSEDLDATLRRAEEATGEEVVALERQAAEQRRTLSELQSSYTELQQLSSTRAGQITTVDEAWVARSPLRPTPVALTLAGAAFGFALATGWIYLFGRGRPAPPTPAPGTAPGPVWNAVPNQKRGSRP